MKLGSQTSSWASRCRRSAITLCRTPVDQPEST
ncbi:MAG: hypothetical protein V7642_2058, partial [Burkholderiales bacterium]